MSGRLAGAAVDSKETAASEAIRKAAGPGFRRRVGKTLVRDLT